MELLSPNGLWLLGLLLPLVVLYILKVRRQRRTVASTWLWQQARRDLMARSPFKRLTPQIPLLLQALAIVLLALAAAAPAMRGKAFDGDHIALVIDTSASMSAIDPGTDEARIELAKHTALEHIDSLAPGSDVMILDAGKDARVALPADRDTRRMQRVIQALSARDVEGDLGKAVALAVGRLQGQRGKRRVVVLSDGNLARDAVLRSPAMPIEVVRVGTPVDNAAIVRVDVRAGTDPQLDAEQVQAFLIVANYGKQPVERYVTMRQRNASDTLASRRVVIQPGEKLPVVLTFEPTQGDYGSGLIFDMAPHDAMAVDDVAYGRVPSGRRLPVVLAGDAPSPWLLRALVSDQQAEVRQATSPELDPALVDHDALVVLDGACPAEIPGGDLLIVNPPSGRCMGGEVGILVEEPSLTSWENSDERMRFLTLDGVFVKQARLLDPPSRRQALIRSDKGTIAADLSTSTRAVTVLGFDVGESNWPLKASFVLFVRNVMELARQHRASGMSGPALAGDPLRVGVPLGADEVTLIDAAGGETRLPARRGLAVVPEMPRSGLYQLMWSKPRPASLWVPVNLTSSAESDLSHLLDEGEDAPAVSDAEAVVEAHDEYTWALALLALLLIAADVWYLTRAPRRRHA